MVRRPVILFHVLHTVDRVQKHETARAARRQVV